jgi:hypothetical protein
VGSKVSGQNYHGGPLFWVSLTSLLKFAWGPGVSSEKLLDKNAIKHKKGKKSRPPRFSDNPKYPHKNNLAKTPRTPLDFQLLFIYDLTSGFLSMNSYSI